MNTKTPLIEVQQVQQMLPLEPHRQTKQQLDNAIVRNFRTQQQLAVVVGPCSADNPQAMSQYLHLLAQWQKQYPHLLLVARVYTSKPHSDGSGFLGLAFHASQGEPCNLNQGILTCRSVMLEALSLGIPVADELLYPQLFPYFQDVVSWWFVGARSSEDSLHRGIASMLQQPCGLKNASNGLMEGAVNNVAAASHPCVFPSEGCQIQTQGNKLAHVVLRGGVHQEGYFFNATPQHTAQCKQLLAQRNLCPFVMVDLSHANSGKIAANQLQNAALVAADKNVNGVMAESFLFGGKAQDCFGVSKTDECLSAQQTEQLLQILQQGFLSRG